MPRWVEAGVAPDQVTAEFWIQVLRDEDIPAIIHPSDAVSYLGVSGSSCRVQVPDDRVDQAREVLTGLDVRR
jgi:hypothetical protein